MRRSKRERGPGRNTPAWQCRADRHHGGPPAHILARQDAELAKRIARRNAAAVAATVAADTRLAPVSEIIVPQPPAPAKAKHPPRSSVPLVTARSAPLEIAPPPATPAPAPPVALPATANRHDAVARRILGGIVAVPVIGLLLALVLPASPPPPPLTPPTLASMRPSSSKPEVVKPASPGSITFAALSLPSKAPDVPSDAPQITPPEPAFVLPPVALPPLAAPHVVVPAPVPDAAAVTPPTPLEPAPVDTAASPNQCRPVASAPASAPPPDASSFGARIAAAALRQTTDIVAYDARYTRIAYPHGDVAANQGVCTDVVIRAYRALGIDMQRLVHEARIGSGDTSIDHRRTETLRKFFARHGESLPVTPFAEDYQPGDIVTYYRPQNRTSTAHIAVVSDVIAPSGRPMIIHSRGLGVQLEDALFVDRITGHYRYVAPVEAPVTAVIASTGRVGGHVQTSAAPGATVVRAAAKSPAAAKLALRFSAAPASAKP